MKTKKTVINKPVDAAKAAKATKATKTAKTAKTAPKWGTREWVAAFPYSEMDKDRRRRVCKFLNLNKPEVPSLSGLCIKAKGELDKIGVAVPADQSARVGGALKIVEAFLKWSLDQLIAYLLNKKFSQGGQGGCQNCQDACDSCKKSCSGPAKTTKKARKAKAAK